MPPPGLWKALFSPRRYLHRTDGVVQPGPGPKGSRQWVLSRGRCLYRMFILAEVPSADREEALQILIQQWSPWADTGKYVAWDRDTAQVWVWDEEQRRQAMTDLGVTAAAPIPESALRRPPTTDGLRVVTGLEGIEAQVWHERRLVASHWWAEEIIDREWVRFLLANDFPPDLTPPRHEEPAWLDRPWARSGGSRMLVNLGRERLWVRVGLAVFVFLLIWQGMALWRWRDATDKLQAKDAALATSADPLLAARAKAMEQLMAMERLTALAAFPSQLELMAAVAAKMPAGKVRWVEWIYNKGKLKFTLQGPDLDPRYYVKACQELPFFRDVVAEKGRTPDTLMVTMDVRPAKER